MKTKIQKIFEKIRDIQYKIPLSYSQKDFCCSGKSEMLIKLLKKEGYNARYRVCVFLWKELNLPKYLEKISHDKDCTHTYVEVFMNKKWVILDATWDKKLVKSFKINEFDGKNSTSIAVKPFKTFSPKKSERIMNCQTKTVIEDDLKRNKHFYKKLNEFLKNQRK